MAVLANTLLHGLFAKRRRVTPMGIFMGLRRLLRLTSNSLLSPSV